MSDDEDQYNYQNDSEEFNQINSWQENLKLDMVEILEMKDVMLVIMKEVQELSEILYFDEDNTFELLMHYNWNKDDITQKYYSASEKLLTEFKANGIINDHQNVIYNGLQGCCTVCFCQEQLILLGCKHMFCESCIKQTIMQRVQKDKFLFVRCLFNGCNYKLPFSMIRKFSNQKEFEDLLCRKFVECSRYLAYCPAVNCNKIIKPKFTSTKEVTCLCQTKFCFYCKEELHPPCPCDLVKKWLVVLKNDQANQDWIRLNTKQCPFCKQFVERSFGCNYMLCKPPGGCANAFCYVCSKPWKPDHKDHYKCNQYVPPKDNTELEKDLIERCNFYSKGYLIQAAAGQKAQESLKKIRDYYIHQIFMYFGFDMHDTQFLEEVMAELIQSRVILKWSYCLSYYISHKNQQSSKLLDHYQQLFEHACESLAISLMKMFNRIEKLNVEIHTTPMHDLKKQFMKLKDTIQNASSKCQKMRLNLESAVYQGDIIV
ncbi:unnamed protein product (macronuclear) [Paramecium tetraurelia]|uniref:RBR-type E3 ubiquitin transferase n=1 Tax=Paramecium tetraurelia TaxID=5888 RepID=A0C1H8_PARTE|nr:uncharacterized protein GSPATT00034121001 [Paramecium tetraurelia]CAK64645.1 unnamed protein product [Paramecium tetraurelia]|eukprot:XP_001432042.1 hypothetical protein (macronuclear) [Paramecium tetraurelia strain d4-2]